MLIPLQVMLVIAPSTVAPCTIGTWTLKASGKRIFLFEIKKTSVGTMATWVRPEHFETDGETFSRIVGPTVRRFSRHVSSVGGNVQLSFEDPTPGATPDIFTLHCAGKGHLSATYQGTSFEPFDLVSDKSKSARQPGPWDSKQTYTRTVVRPTNPEMTAIFDADQADREVSHIDWSVVGPADKRRQLRTQTLLDAGALNSGDDFYHAAFVFQHGSKPGDYLKAHLLAMVAAARGNAGAVWIASATLDRYLQSVGKPQVLGTQYGIPKGAPATQEPYDRDLVSDAMRKALLVPTLAEQERRRQQLTQEALNSKKP